MIVKKQLRKIYNTLPENMKRILFELPLAGIVNEIANLADLGPKTRNTLEVMVQMALLGMYDSGEELYREIEEVAGDNIKAEIIKKNLEDKVFSVVGKRMVLSEADDGDELAELEKMIKEAKESIKKEMVREGVPAKKTAKISAPSFGATRNKDIEV